jgi:hypothetical protein
MIASLSVSGMLTDFLPCAIILLTTLQDEFLHFPHSIDEKLKQRALK